jgi:hypothetical protein
MNPAKNCFTKTLLLKKTITQSYNEVFLKAIAVCLKCNLFSNYGIILNKTSQLKLDQYS